MSTTVCANHIIALPPHNKPTRSERSDTEGTVRERVLLLTIKVEDVLQQIGLMQVLDIEATWLFEPNLGNIKHTAIARKLRTLNADARSVFML